VARATTLARAMGEAMNMAAFTALCAVTPAIVATILFLRKRPRTKR
jgi:hypothetical protein